MAPEPEGCRSCSRRRRSRSGRRRSACRPRRRKGNDRKRDPERDAPHFAWEKGLPLGPEGRYAVRRLLGDGTFGRVLSCADRATGDTVAVKVVKGVERYCEHAAAEAEVLEEILRKDPDRRGLCVELRDTFLHRRKYFCLVFEPLDTSIRDFLKKNRNRGMYIADARKIARQLLESMEFLHGIGVTHTDLKCRNVMLRDGSFDLAPHPRVEGVETRRPRDCRISVIDFGGAVFADERHGGRIGTRQFRAPEVVLGLRWDEKVDLWSVGCIIAMLYIGQRPFSMHEDMEHLAMMERKLGVAFPRRLSREAVQEGCLPEGVFFEDDGMLAWPRRAPDEDALVRVQELVPLCEQICPHHGDFLVLLRGLLEIDPRRRLAAGVALQIAFFSGCPPAE